MQSPLEGFELLTVDQAVSTQDLAAQELANPSSRIGAVITPNQIGGRGRFKREWITPPGEALTVSLIFRHQANHPAPHLIGMAVAIAAAGATKAHLQWPNDLVIQGKKVGGILTEMGLDAHGKSVAIVGVGINVNQSEFPDEIKDRAISLFQAFGHKCEAGEVLESMLAHLTQLPEPGAWNDLAPIWDLFDQTPRKKYTLPDGRVVTALGIGAHGELIASDEGHPITVLAADAIFSRIASTPLASPDHFSRFR